MIFLLPFGDGNENYPIKRLFGDNQKQDRN